MWTCARAWSLNVLVIVSDAIVIQPLWKEERLGRSSTAKKRTRAIKKVQIRLMNGNIMKRDYNRITHCFWLRLGKKNAKRRVQCSLKDWVMTREVRVRARKQQRGGTFLSFLASPTCLSTPNCTPSFKELERKSESSILRNGSTRKRICSTSTWPSADWKLALWIWVVVLTLVRRISLYSFGLLLTRPICSCYTWTDACRQQEGMWVFFKVCADPCFAAQLSNQESARYRPTHPQHCFHLAACLGGRK